MYSWKIATPPGRMTAAILSSRSAGDATKQATQRHQLASMPPAGSGSRHEVELVVLDVDVAVAREHGAARLDEARGALDGDDPSRRPHDFREVGGGEARSRADVEHLRARADAGAAPALEHGRPPDAVLQAEALELLVVGAEEVSALGHQSHFALRRRWNR